MTSDLPIPFDQLEQAANDFDDFDRDAIKAIWNAFKSAQSKGNGIHFDHSVESIEVATFDSPFVSKLPGVENLTLYSPAGSQITFTKNCITGRIYVSSWSLADNDFH